jgi:hypothetical protein
MKKLILLTALLVALTSTGCTDKDQAEADRLAKKDYDRMPDESKKRVDSIKEDIESRRFSDYEEARKAYITTANNNCPIKMDDWQTITSYSYDPDTLALQYNITLDLPEGMDEKAFIQNMSQFIKLPEEIAVTCLQQKEIFKGFNSLEYVFSSPTGEHVGITTITKSECEQHL